MIESRGLRMDKSGRIQRDKRFKTISYIDNPLLPHADAISDKQLGMLKSMLNGQDEREAGLLKYYKITDLSHLSWKHMQDVVTALKGKE